MLGPIKIPPDTLRSLCAKHPPPGAPDGHPAGLMPGVPAMVSAKAGPRAPSTPGPCEISTSHSQAVNCVPKQDHQALASLVRVVHQHGGLPHSAKSTLPGDIWRLVSCDEAVKQLCHTHSDLFQCQGTGASATLRFSSLLEQLCKQMIQHFRKNPELHPSVLGRLYEGNERFRAVVKKLGGVAGLAEAFSTAFMLKERTMVGGGVQKFFVLRPNFMDGMRRAQGFSVQAADAVARLDRPDLVCLMQVVHRHGQLTVQAMELLPAELQRTLSTPDSLEQLCVLHPDLFQCRPGGKHATLCLSPVSQQLWEQLVAQFRQNPELHPSVLGSLYQNQERFRVVVRKLGGVAGLAEAFGSALMLKESTTASGAAQPLLVLRCSCQEALEGSGIASPLGSDNNTTKALARVMRVVHQHGELTSGCLDLLPADLQRSITSEEILTQMCLPHPDLLHCQDPGSASWVLRLSELSQKLWEALVEKFQKSPELHPSVLGSLYRSDERFRKMVKKLGGVTGLAEAFGAAVTLKEYSAANGAKQAFLVLKSLFKEEASCGSSTASALASEAPISDTSDKPESTGGTDEHGQEEVALRASLVDGVGAKLDHKALAHLVRLLHQHGELYAGTLISLLPAELQQIIHLEDMIHMCIVHPDLFRRKEGDGGTFIVCLSPVTHKLWDQLVEQFHRCSELHPCVLGRLYRGEECFRVVVKKLGGVAGLAEAFGTAMTLKESATATGGIQHLLVIKPAYMEILRKLPAAPIAWRDEGVEIDASSGEAEAQTTVVAAPAQKSEGVPDLDCHVLATLVRKVLDRGVLLESGVDHLDDSLQRELSWHGGLKNFAIAYPDLFQYAEGTPGALCLSALLLMLWENVCGQFKLSEARHVGPLMAELYRANPRFRTVVKKLGGGKGLAEAFGAFVTLRDRVIGVGAVQQLLVLRGPSNHAYAPTVALRYEQEQEGSSPTYTTDERIVWHL